MKLKEAVYDKCSECGVIKSTVQEESFGCDGCKRPIDDLLKAQGGTHHEYLEVTIFRDPRNSNSERMQFCSWKCVLDKLPKIKCNYFISLPYLHFDESQRGIRAKDFFSEVRKRKGR